MTMGGETKHLYEFGPYRLDPVKRVLLKEGAPVQLTPKAFDTLLVLVESTGDVLEKDDLIRRVWPDSFVEEGNLTVNISMLRKALGERPNQHRYIVTVPGRGYRFVENVRELLEAGEAVVVEERERTRVVIEEQSTSSFERFFAWVLRGLRKRSRVLAICTILIVATIAGIAWSLIAGWKPAHRQINLSSLQMTQLASWKTEPHSPATVTRFSPDGKMVAFSSTKSGHSNLWVKQSIEGDQIQITKGDWTDLTPLWSPDGDHIAFISDRGGQQGIWLSLSLGGAATLLKRLEGESNFLRDWSKDSKTIYYEANHNLYGLDIESKNSRQLTRFDSSRGLTRDFAVSSDENWIAYADSDGKQFDIWIVPMDGDSPRRVTDDSNNDLYPTWHGDGNRIIYSSDRGSAYQICVAYLDGRAPQQITFTTDDCVGADVSPDGTRIIFTTVNEESDLWAVGTDTGEEFEITSEVGLEAWPESSSDGKSILFQSANGSERLLDSKVFAKSINGDGQETQITSRGFDAHWSPDGRKIGFLRFFGDMFNLWVIDSSGGEEKQLTDEGIKSRSFRLIPFNRGQDGGYSWSPDNNRIAYCAKSSDQRNIWTVNADGSNKTRISNLTDPNLVFTRPLWSRDSGRIASVIEPRSLSVTGQDEWQLWVSDRESIFKYPSYLWLVGWSTDRPIVASTEDKDGFELCDVGLFFVSMEGTKEPITKLTLVYADNIELSPDAKSVAFVSRIDGRDNVWMTSISGGSPIKLTANRDPRLFLSTLTWSSDSKKIYFGKQIRSSEVTLITNFT